MCYPLTRFAAEAAVCSLTEIWSTMSHLDVYTLNDATGQLAYRGFRIPSLYPGVESTQSAIATANLRATPQAVSKGMKQ